MDTFHKARPKKCLQHLTSQRHKKGQGRIFYRRLIDETLIVGWLVGLDGWITNKMNKLMVDVEGWE